MAAAVLALILASCAFAQEVDTAVMPRSAVGTPVMTDEGAIGLAAYALGSPARTRGRPVEAALGLAAVDYLAGALSTNPRWDGISASVRGLMLQGRQEVRSTLGIAPGTSSQEVVDRLVAAASALQAGNQAAAESALNSPRFTLGPQRTLALLDNLPPLRQANVAAQRANAEIMTNCTFNARCK